MQVYSYRILLLTESSSRFAQQSGHTPKCVLSSMPALLAVSYDANQVPRFHVAVRCVVAPVAQNCDELVRMLLFPCGVPGTPLLSPDLDALQ